MKIKKNRLLITLGFLLAALSLPRAQAAISEIEFNGVIDELEAAYAPLVSAQGGHLVAWRQWGNNAIAADSSQPFFAPGQWVILFTGGLARTPEMTRDAFTLIACHEMGHHLGGFPNGGIFKNLSVEGEADYYATHVCTHKLWKNEREQNAQSARLVDAYAKKLCDQVWPTEDERNLCYRATVATQAMWNTKAHLLGSAQPQFNTPNLRVVPYYTETDHPELQCRMDTSLQGALCTAAFDETKISGKHSRGDSAELEMAAQSCTPFSHYEVGLRPRCWFLPHASGMYP